MKRKFFYILIISCFLLSCGFSDLKRLNPEASRSAGEYYDYLQKGDVKATVPLFDDQFFDKLPVDTYLARISEVYGVDGEQKVITSRSLLFSKYREETVNSKYSGAFTQVYKVTYSNGYVSKDEIIFDVNKQKELGKIKAVYMRTYSDSL